MLQVSNSQNFNTNLKCARFISMTEFMNLTGNNVAFESSAIAEKSVANNFSKDIEGFQGTNGNKILFEDFMETCKKQGIICKAYDEIKNVLGCKTGSKYVENILKENRNNKVSNQEAAEAIKKYYNNQNKALDFIGDIGSSLLGLGTFAFVMSVFGASIPIGLVAATCTGALTKAAIKKADAKSANREYKSFNYDLITGSINGILSPVVTGMSNAFIKDFAKLRGIKTLNKYAVPIGIKSSQNEYAKLIFCPKQKIEANLFIKSFMHTYAKVVKSGFKIGFAALLRKIAFNYFSRSANNYSLASRFVKKFHPNNPIDEDKFKNIDLSNEM